MNVEDKAPDRWLTLPNGICVARFAGSFMIIPFVIAERSIIVLTLFLLLAITDWIDGKLARWFDQRSRIGPRLDSIADITMYSVFLFAAAWLHGDVFVGELPLLVTAGTCFFLGCLASIIKFRRFPSYHTRAAKISWFLMVLAATAIFMQWSVWPFRVALVVVSYANLESVLITYALSQPTTDIASFRAARRLERKRQAAPSKA